MGLRILVLCKKEINEEEYNIWAKQFKVIFPSLKLTGCFLLFKKSRTWNWSR